MWSGLPPSVCHGELRTNLVPNLVFLSVGVIYVHVPILGEIDGKTSVERQIGVLLVGSVGVLHFVVRRAHVATLVVQSHRIGGVPTIEIQPWVGSS